MEGIGRISGPGLPINGVRSNVNNNESFVDTLKDFVKQVDSQLKYADKKMENFAVQKETNIHEVMIAMEKADLSLKFLVRIRNKLIEAYQEIMRMQV